MIWQPCPHYSLRHIRLDERQENANRLYKASVMKILKPVIQKLAAIVTSRERDVDSVARNFFVTAEDRDPVLGLLRRRTHAVKTAQTTLEGELAFSAGGREALLSRHG